MKKGEIISKISSDLCVSRQTVFVVLNAFLDIVIDSIIKGEEVRIIDFGLFRTNIIKPRMFKAAYGKYSLIAKGERLNLLFKPIGLFKDKLEFLRKPPPQELIDQQVMREEAVIPMRDILPKLFAKDGISHYDYFAKTKKLAGIRKAKKQDQLAEMYKEKVNQDKTE